jgi:hypothetical protein
MLPISGCKQAIEQEIRARHRIHPLRGCSPTRTLLEDPEGVVICSDALVGQTDRCEVVRVSELP